MADQGLKEDPPKGTETATYAPLEERLADINLQQMQNASNLGSTLSLHNLPASFDIQDVLKLFKDCGHVTAVEVVSNVAFVSMARRCDAESAFTLLDGKEIGEPVQVLRVNWKSKENHVTSNCGIEEQQPTINPTIVPNSDANPQLLNTAIRPESHDKLQSQSLSPITTPEVDSEVKHLNPATPEESDNKVGVLNPIIVPESDNKEDLLKYVITPELDTINEALKPVITPELDTINEALKPVITTELESKDELLQESCVQEVDGSASKINEEENSTSTENVSASCDSETTESSESSEEESDSSSSGLENAFFEPDDESKKYESGTCEKGGGIMSKNEVNTESIHIPSVSIEITSSDELERIGTVHSILEKEVIIRSANSIEDEMRHTWSKEDIDKSSAFTSGTVMCFENRTALGVLFDTFGPVHSPYYIVRFNTSDEIASLSDLKEGVEVFAVQAHRQVVVGRDVHVKGYDTSNKDDEECETGDYSDDEEERAARRKKNLMHRQRLGVADDDHRPLKQTRGDNQTGVDEQIDNPYETRLHPESMTENSYRGRGRGRGRRRGRGRERNRGRGHGYGDSVAGAYENHPPAAPPPRPPPPPGVHMGGQHVAQQIFEARLQQPSVNVPPMGIGAGYSNSYPQTGGVYVDRPPASYGTGANGFVHPIPQYAPVMWNGPQYMQMPVSPMQHYPPMHGMGYPSVPHAQMQAMAGVRNMSVQENGTGQAQSFYAMPMHPNMSVRPPSANTHPNNGGTSQYNGPQPPS